MPSTAATSPNRLRDALEPDGCGRAGAGVGRAGSATLAAGPDVAVGTATRYLGWGGWRHSATVAASVKTRVEPRDAGRGSALTRPRGDP